LTVNELNSEEQKVLQKILKDYRDIQYSDGDELTFTTSIKHEIKTKQKNQSTGKHIRMLKFMKVKLTNK